MSSRNVSGSYESQPDGWDRSPDWSGRSAPGRRSGSGEYAQVSSRGGADPYSGQRRRDDGYPSAASTGARPQPTFVPHPHPVDPRTADQQDPRPGEKFWSALISVAPYLDRNVNTFRSRVDWNLSDYLTFNYTAGYSDFKG